MRVAVIADVHANAVALDAVLAAIDRADVQVVACLGDLVGYHAQPVETIARIRTTAEVVVAGNHDREVASGATAGTSAAARRALGWTHEQLSASDLAYLAGLPSHVVTTEFVAAHGSYLSDLYVSGYVTSTMLADNLCAIAARPGWPRLALCGHTHQPMIGWIAGAELHESVVATTERWPADVSVVLANPGSVGQPRDGDPRASWGLLDLEASSFTVHRTPYDIDAACAAIARAGLPLELAARLREGR